MEPVSPTEVCVLCAKPGAESIAGAPEFFHCAQCDLRFLAPSRRLQFNDEESRYRSHNNDIHDAGYRAFLQPLVDSLLPRLQVGAQGLDFGCGPGPLLVRMLREHGFQMQLFDPIFQPNRPSTGARFDFITSSEVVEHLFTPLPEFRQLHNWLHPGGWLAIMTALVEPPVNFVDWYYRRDPTHVVFYSRRTFTWIGKELGFDQLTWVGDRIALMRKLDHGKG